MHRVFVGGCDYGTVGGWYEIFAEMAMCWGNIVASGACIFNGLVVLWNGSRWDYGMSIGEWSYFNIWY